MYKFLSACEPEGANCYNRRQAQPFLTALLINTSCRGAREAVCCWRSPRLCSSRGCSAGSLPCSGRTGGSWTLGGQALPLTKACCPRKARITRWMESVDFIPSLSCLESWKWRGSFAHMLAFQKILPGFLSVSWVPGTPAGISRPILGQHQSPHVRGSSAGLTGLPREVLKSCPLPLFSASCPYPHSPLLWHDACSLTTLFVLSHFIRVRLFATPWTVGHQTPLSMGFSRQEYWSGLLCLPPGDLPDPGIQPASLMSPALAGGFFTTSAAWEAHWQH